MIIRNNTDQTIESLKSLAHIQGDVYLIDGHLLESLESHNRIFQSNCSTIEEAEAERLHLLEEEAHQIAEMAKEKMLEA